MTTSNVYHYNIEVYLSFWKPVDSVRLTSVRRHTLTVEEVDSCCLPKALAVNTNVYMPKAEEIVKGFQDLHYTLELQRITLRLVGQGTLHTRIFPSSQILRFDHAITPGTLCGGCGELFPSGFRSLTLATIERWVESDV